MNDRTYHDLRIGARIAINSIASQITEHNTAIQALERELVIWNARDTFISDTLNMRYDLDTVSEKVIDKYKSIQ